MESQKIVKMMLTDAGKSSRDLDQAFNTTKAGAATKVSKGIYSVKDFITVANACDAEINVKLKGGLIIPLTLDDIEK